MVRIKIGHNTHVALVVLPFFLPLPLIGFAISPTVGMVMLGAALGAGFVMSLGTPPVLIRIILVVTSLAPLGLPISHLVIDGVTGKIYYPSIMAVGSQVQRLRESLTEASGERVE